MGALNVYFIIFWQKKWCSHRESNPDQRFRKPSFYPLNYESIPLEYHYYKLLHAVPTMMDFIRKRLEESINIRSDWLCALILLYRVGFFLEANWRLYQKQLGPEF